MDNYLLYVGVAAATILLPGPAVMLTINNSIQRGLLMALAGILGIALAILVVAAISATSLGIILASSVMAFTLVKLIGATYLLIFRRNISRNLFCWPLPLVRWLSSSTQHMPSFHHSPKQN